VFSAEEELEVVPSKLSLDKHDYAMKLSSYLLDFIAYHDPLYKEK
jgi:hypothetical protein